MEQLCNISVVREVMERHNFRFSKALGQNFLINPSVCPRIAEDGVRDSEYGAIEIGTGVGVLTNELAKRAKKVVAIEIDERLLPILDETLAEYDNVEIIHADVLKVDLNRLIRERLEGMDVCVCANLPYYITSPVIMALLEQRLPIRSVTVMVQKEAAQRLCAQVGTRDCGAVTFAVRYYSEPKQLFAVSRGSFMPAPNVDSAVIRLEVREWTDLDVRDERFLFRVVKAAFSQRRKTLANPVSSILGLSKQRIGEVLQELGIKSTVRAEEMKFEEWILLANRLFEEKGHE